MAAMPPPTLVNRLVSLAGLVPQGLSGGALTHLVDASERDVRAALEVCVRNALVCREPCGRFRSTAMSNPDPLGRRTAQALAARLRRILARVRESPEAWELAEVLLRLEGPVSAPSLKVVAEFCESQRRSSPEQVLTIIEKALAADGAADHKAECYQLTLMRVGCLPVNAGDAVWRATFDALFSAALAVDDIHPLLEALRYRVIQLRESGQYPHAEAELRHALAVLGENDEARVHIQLLLGQCQSFRGDLAAAHQTYQGLIAESEAKGLPNSVQIIQSINSLAAMLLAENAAQRLEQQLAAAVRRRDDASASIAALLAADLSLIFGTPTRARVLAREAALRGTGLGKNWRDADRAVIEASLALAMGELGEFEDWVGRGSVLAHDAGNRPALRRLLALRLRHAILRSDRPALVSTLEMLQDTSQALEPVFTVGDAGIVAAAELALGQTPSLRTDLSFAGTHAGLGGVLAAMETVAIVGPRGPAVALWRWSEEALQRSIVTAVDWPVLLERVAALVALRFGKRQQVGDRLTRAIQRADALGFRVEGAIARLQYAEIAEAAGLRVKGESIAGLREKAIEYLLRLGYQPEPIALLATQAWIRGGAPRSVVDLSKREAEVLQVLAEGHTYREAAARLGTSWRTVQTQAKHAYAKLGATGKQDAIAKAKRRGDLGNALQPARRDFPRHGSRLT